MTLSIIEVSEWELSIQRGSGDLLTDDMVTKRVREVRQAGGLFVAFDVEWVTWSWINVHVVNENWV